MCIWPTQYTRTITTVSNKQLITAQSVLYWSCAQTRTLGTMPNCVLRKTCFIAISLKRMTEQLWCASSATICRKSNSHYKNKQPAPSWENGIRRWKRSGKWYSRPDWRRWNGRHARTCSRTHGQASTCHVPDWSRTGLLRIHSFLYESLFDQLFCRSGW